MASQHPGIRLILLLILLWGSAVQARSFQGVVTHVSDGDTLWVRPASGGEPRKLRLQGIDAPEICQAFGPQSRDALASRLLHQPVVVSTRARDTYGRLLGRISRDGEDMGAWMVSRGYAWSYHYRRNPGPYAAQQWQAQMQRRGLWAGGGAMEPREFRKRHGACHGVGS